MVATGGTVDPTSEASLSLTCPSARAVGGGGSIGGPGATTHLSTLDVNDSIDLGSVHDNGFSLEGLNGSAATQPTSITAICLKGNAAGILDYESDTTVAAAGPASFTGGIACDAGKETVGGGVGLEGPATEVFLKASYPGDDEWTYSAVKLPTGGTRDLRVDVVCLVDDTRPVRRVSRQAVVNELSVKTLKVSCPSSFHASAGGVQGFVNLLTSRPFDAADPDKAPDDGWSARMYNPNSNSPAVGRVWAVCIK